MNTPAHDGLLATLAARFARYKHRHTDLTWSTVAARLATKPGALATLQRMEDSGGEPDVIGIDSGTEQVLFCDCATESPSGRRSLCYDGSALAARKENKPRGSALEMAAVVGIELLTEEDYRVLQTLGEFDTKTSSWIATPKDVRSRGGALFGDRRYGRVFTYHNGAESYYAARGFRGLVRV
jgi:hypothetical protein